MTVTGSQQKVAVCILEGLRTLQLSLSPQSFSLSALSSLCLALKAWTIPDWGFSVSWNAWDAKFPQQQLHWNLGIGTQEDWCIHQQCARQVDRAALPLQILYLHCPLGRASSSSLFIPGKTLVGVPQLDLRISCCWYWLRSNTHLAW